jgi:hypothetical protein
MNQITTMTRVTEEFYGPCVAAAPEIAGDVHQIVHQPQHALEYTLPNGKYFLH